MPGAQQDGGTWPQKALRPILMYFVLVGWSVARCFPPFFPPWAVKTDRQEFPLKVAFESINTIAIGTSFA